MDFYWAGQCGSGAHHAVVAADTLWACYAGDPARGNVFLEPFELTYPTNPPLLQIDGKILLGGGENVHAITHWG